MKNLKKVAAVIALIITMVLAIGYLAFVRADSTKTYLLDVVNARGEETDIEENEDIIVSQKILKDNDDEPFYDDRELTLQLDITSKKEWKNPEIAMIFDTSYSVTANDPDNLLKTSAADLAGAIYDNCSGATITLYNAQEAITSRLSASSKSTMISKINSMGMNVGSNIADAITVARSSFSSDDTNKFVILFTDGTDYISTELADLVADDIKVITVSKDNVINNSYYDGSELIGYTQMVYSSTIEDEDKLFTSFNKSAICDIFNNSINSISLNEKFSNVIKDYLEISYINGNGSATAGIDGFTWNCDSIPAGSTKTLVFKLKIKEGINITDPSYLYHNLVVGDNFDISYTPDMYSAPSEIKSFEFGSDHMPIIKICDKYSVTLKAVSEENKDILIPGIKFNVLAKDSDGRVVYRQNDMISDINGQVVIDNLKTTGTVHFIAEPIVDMVGYDDTSMIEFDISNSFGTNFTVDTPEWVANSYINNSTRDISINVPIKTQKFAMEINLTELYNSNVTLSDVDFRLIQPKLNEKYEMKAIFGTTGADGKVVIYPTALPKAGQYEYILSQMTTVTGYKSVGNVTIRITFDDNGLVVVDGIEKEYNDNVDVARISPNYVVVNVGNKALMDDTFDFEINLFDEEDPSIKLDDAEYEIENVTYGITQRKITSGGNIKISTPGSGYVQLKVTQLESKTGYVKDEESKNIVIFRNGGAVQSIVQAYNMVSLIPVDATAYSVDNKVVVNLYNKKRLDRNLLKVRLSDFEENDIFIPGVELKLKNKLNNKEYTGTTDIDGITSFHVDNEPAGVYPYSIEVVSGLSVIYKDLETAEISLQFNDDGDFAVIGNIWSGSSAKVDPVLSLEGINVYPEEVYTNYEGIANLGAILKEEYKSKLEINLFDKDDPSIPLQGAKYNINIQSTVASGQSFVRDLKNRETDVNGKIETSLVNADKIIVRISQKQAAPGYKRNEATKEIELKYVDGVLSLVDASITDVVIDGNKLIVKDYGRKITSNDIYLDFTIVKQDMSGGLIGGLPIRIISEAYNDITASSTTVTPTLPSTSSSAPSVGDEIGQLDGFLSDGVKYGSWIETCGSPSSPIPLTNSDHVYIETTTDSNGTIVLKGLPVHRVSDRSEARFILYVVEYDPVTGANKESSLIKFMLTYRYNPAEDVQSFQLTNLDATIGMARVVKKEIDGGMTDIGYESRAGVVVYGNYDDVGNLSLDLLKENDKGDKLDGAKYIVRTTRPDGSFINNKVDVDNQNVELPGIVANAGTQIEITEAEEGAPLGYSKDPFTKLLTVEEVTETGEIVLSLSDGDRSLNKAVLERIRTYVTDAGTLKNEYRLKLIDYELNTFDIKVNSINAVTGESVGSYQYQVTSSKGAQKNTRNLFDAQEVVVGSNYKDEVLNYYLTNNNVPLYYKPHEDFKLNVAFDSETKVDSSTLDLQTDPLYGNPSAGGTWEIAGINVNKTQEEKNAPVERDVSPKDIFDVVLNVYVYPEEPLEVEVETIDTVSGGKVTGVSYKITPSINLDGIGVFNSTTENVDVEVGYSLKDSTSMYTLITTVPNNYINVDDQEFVIGYDSNSNINSHVISSYSHLNLVVTGDKSIKLTNYVTPKQGIQILNSDYYTGDRIGNSKFEITTEDGAVINADVDLTGITSILGSAHGEANSNVRYKIHQKTHAEGYVSVDDFDIIVYYGSNREIVNVTLDNCTEPDLIDVSAICPSSSTDLGYNGNSKGIVKIEIKNIYDFRVNIENVDRFDNTVKIQGTNYSVTSTLGASGSATTQVDGIGTAHLDEKKNSLATGVPVIYTITEASPSREYQILESAIDVEVMFDTNGYVIPSSVKVISGHGDDYANAYGISVIANATDKFTINVKITSVPKIRFLIHNVDFYKGVADATRNLAGAEFKCDPECGDGIENVTTDDLGEAILRVNTCQRGTPFVYEISQVKAAYGYQRMEENIKIEVQFNADGSIGSCALLQGNRFASATVDAVTSSTSSFAVNLEIKSSPLVNINIDNINTTVDDSGAVTVNKIKNVEYKVTAFEYDSNTDLNASNSGVTDVNGQTTIPMDRALSNKDIKYVIHQVTKSVDYERIECDIIIKLHIKNNGKIQSGSWSIISDDSGASAAGFATIKSVDVDNFNVNIEIENNPIKEFGVHLRAVDMYTDEPIDGVVANTYLTQNLSDTVLYVSDHEYDLEKVNEGKTYSDDRYKYLCTGADRDGNGYADVAIGEDFQSLGQYIEKDKNSRVLRIVLKDVPAGYQWYANSVRATQSYHILIKVNFDEDGKVVSTQVMTGLIDKFGSLANGKYVSVEPSGYGIAVRLKFYKTLNTRLEAQDMYTGDILEGKFRLSTSRYLDEQTVDDEITEGYIGGWYSIGAVYKQNQSHDYIPAARTEQSCSRKFRLYEESAPIEGYYQQYRPKNFEEYFQRKIAEIVVEYDANGCIENAYVSSYSSSNNINSGYIDLEWSGCNLSIRVKYVPTTKIVTTVVDRVTGTPLSDVAIHPFSSCSPYSINDLGRIFYTNAAGKCSVKYWRANVAESVRNYKITTSFESSKFDGYYSPGEINIDVLYNNIGRIGSVKVLSNNTFGDAPNAEWTAEDNVVYLTIKLDRKFKIKLNKQDIYDSSEKLNVKFNIESSKHETKEFNSGSTTAIGRIHPGADVVYTLSEVGGIDGYIPLTNIKMYVHFNTDGTIGDVHVERGYEKYFEIQSTASVEAGIRGVNTVDLEFVVKNIPRFNASIKLTDAFYSTVGLSGGNFTLTSDMGETASGALVTDENGNAATSIGEVHPNETVVYTLTQTNTINGYNSNPLAMKFSIKYNEKGNIESYTVLSGNSMLYIKPSIYNGTKSMVLEVSNEPKDVNIGIVNLDYDTGEGINDINYEVQITDIDTGVTDVKNYITQSNLDGDGTVSGVVDNVKKSVEKRRVNYKVIEKNVPATYRKIKDMDFTITYNEDGSIESYVINSNESNADIEIFAKDTAIRKLNGILAHIKITIKNDNRYDLIINDFDKNYTSLGVKGTKYKVLIDGDTKTVPATNDLGQTLLSRNEGSGTINLDVAEDEIGNGYRADLSNLVNIVLDKGTGVYSLKLNPSTPGYINDKSASDGNAIISVDEEAGLVYVTFVNETKYQFDVKKYDKKTGDSLSNVEFEITSYELDDFSNKVLSTENAVTTAGVDDATDSEGYLHFDLGTTPQNKKMVYVFDEVAAPDGYEEIEEFEVYVDFDFTGQLENKSDNSPYVETAINPDNKNGIVVLVGNEPIVEPEEDPDHPEDPVPTYATYNIKVVSRDSVTKKRINGSKFNIDIRQSDGTQLQAMNGRLTSDDSISGLVIERGVVKSDDLKAENIVTVDVDQIGLAEGYEYSSQTSGIVELQVDYILDSDGINKKPDISLINDDGLEVEIDNSNRVVTIIVDNDPGVTLDIYNYLEETSYDVESSNYISTVTPLQNSKFRITSYVRTATSTTPTTLNKAFPMTDDAGNTSVGIGCPVAGKEIVYTIIQDPILGFENIGDIVLAVKYDSSGNIKAVNVESDLDVTKVVEGSINGKKFGIEVKNHKERYLDPYNIVLEKHSIHDGEYDYLIPNATFQITVKEEYGVERSWFDTTNADGIITSPEFNGYGRIKVVYTEIAAPEGFMLDNNTHYIEFIRERETGLFRLIFSDENFEFDETLKKTVYVKPQDELQKGRYDFVINIVKEGTKERIHSNTSTFEVYLVKDEVDELLGTVTTDADGHAVLRALHCPEDAGKYQFKVKQITPPDGYTKVQDEYLLDVWFTTSLGYNEITNVINDDTAHFDLKETKNNLVGIDIWNKGDGILGGIKLSISDVDKDTGNLIIGRPALFELTDDDGTTQYDLNYETGLLEISGLPIPDASEFGIKDDGTDVTEIVHNYKLKQIAQPYEYLLNTNEYDISIKFVLDPTDGKVIIDSVSVTTGTDTVTSTLTGNDVEFTVENEPAEYGSGYKNYGTYSLNIEKLDEMTSEPITDRTTFEVMLENGQAFTASTDENGNMLIKDIKVPSTVNKDLGPYSYVIEETKAAEGYIIRDRYTIIDITFKEKERTDPDEEITYVIDTVEKLMGDQAVITSYDESEVNITIYNKLDGFDIIYDQNSDDTTISNIPDNQYKINGEDIVLSDMVPERDGYIFKGWSTTPTGTVVYNPGDTYTTDAELNLYAVWEEKLYLKSTKYLIGKRPDVYTEGTETSYENNVDDDNKYIGNLIPKYKGHVPGETIYTGTTVADLKANITTNGDVVVLKNKVDSDGEIREYELGDDEYIGTNMILKITKGDQEPIILNTVVLGDVAHCEETVGVTYPTYYPDDNKLKDYKITKKTISGKVTLVYNYGDGIVNGSDSSELKDTSQHEDVRRRNPLSTDSLFKPEGAFRKACDVIGLDGIIQGSDFSAVKVVTTGKQIPFDLFD